ncbi:MAG: hypothetical protein MZV70_32780 [Desulfobacterales bacterium]|nr:hypothetical protein [Desulfobacterales bacterium]
MPANAVEVEAAEARRRGADVPERPGARDRRRPGPRHPPGVPAHGAGRAGCQRPAPAGAGQGLRNPSADRHGDLGHRPGAGCLLCRQRRAEDHALEHHRVPTPPPCRPTSPILFVAGDVATGPSLVVDAIGGGRRAARSIHQFVTGRPVEAEPNELRKNLLTETIFDRVPGVVPRPRAKMVELPAAERIRSFDEVDQVLTEEAARRESDRCLYCCLTCYNPDTAAPGAARRS